MSYYIAPNGAINSGPAPEGCTPCEEGDAIYLAALAALQGQQAKAQEQAAAQAALDKADVSALRALKQGIAIPAFWLAYEDALRLGIKEGGLLPTIPATYPDGTPTA